MADPTYCQVGRHQPDNYLSFILATKMKESNQASCRSCISSHQVRYTKLYCSISSAPYNPQYFAQVYKLFRQLSKSHLQIVALCFPFSQPPCAYFHNRFCSAPLPDTSQHTLASLCVYPVVASNSILFL